MNCEQVQSLLVAYVEGEVTPSERTLIQAHLSNCTVCQQELTLLFTARSRVRSMLQRQAVHAVPSRDAWNRLEAKLTKAEQLSSKKEAWFSSKAPNANHASNLYKKFGGVSMKSTSINKRSVFSIIAGVVVLAILVVFVARNVTPASASAQQILDRAYQAQTQAGPTQQGIEHLRSEIYSDVEANGQGMNTIVESYSDPTNGNFRVVTTDQSTGKVLQVNAFDGANVYTSDKMPDGQPSTDPLTVYHNVQDAGSLTNQKFMSVMNRKLNPAQDDESRFMFEKMRSDPQVELAGQEAWDNGHTVYALRSQQEIKLMVNDEMTHPMGLVTFYFDVDTYQLLGSRVTTEKDGKEVVISTQKTLLDEILPADSNVAWDLSDLQGINIVEDPNGEHSLPAKIALKVISVEELASKTDSAYLLKAIPDGFSLEISTQSEQPANDPFVYEARYTNQAGEYFLIRALGKPLEDNSWNGETYTTAGGLVLHFVGQDGGDAKRVEFTRVLIEALNGKTYAIESSLPVDTVKAFAEDLELLK